MSADMAASLARLVEETRARLAGWEALLDAAQANDAESASFEESFAVRARSGALGREWAVLQGRIDLGETTLEAIMTGADDSAEAQTVRERAHERIGDVADIVRDQAKAEGRADPVAQLARQREEMLARAAELQRRVEKLAEGE